VLAQLRLVRDIKRVKSVCKSFRDAVPEAEKEHRRRTGVYEHEFGVSSVTAAPGGRFITISYEHGNCVKLWRDGACERTIKAHMYVSAVAVLPGGARFVSVSSRTTAKRWPHAAKLWTIDGALERNFAAGVEAQCVAALPDGVHFVIGTGSFGVPGEVRLYHVDGTLVHTFMGHTRDVWTVVVTPDGKHIISGAHDNLVKVWNVANKSLASTCAGHTHRVVAAMPDNQRFLSGGGRPDNTVRVWRLDGTLENTFQLHAARFADLVTALVALPDNQHALSGSLDKTVKLFNVNDGIVLRTFRHHADAVNSLALMPDGLRFISGSDDKTTRIVEIGPVP
jgi:hypothetical protein